MAEAVIDAIEEDNPDTDIYVLDRDDHVRIHTDSESVLSQTTIRRRLGPTYDLAMLEIQMPSFKGRMETRNEQYRWYCEHKE